MSDPIRVLAIDDNADNLIVLEAILREIMPNCVTMTATTGERGIRMAEVFHPEVILLDIVMPGMDGYEVCRRIKKIAALQPVPILFLTAQKADRAIRIRALEAGAEGFLTKPIDETELFTQVSAMARICEANLRCIAEGERERRAAEDALNESSLFNHQIIQSVNEGIVVYGTDLRCRIWNPYMERLTGYLNKTVIGRDLFELFPFLVDAGQPDRVRLTLRGEILDTVEFPFAVPEHERDGWWRSHYAPLRNVSGEIIGAIVTVEDITERREREEALRYLNYHDVLTGLYNRYFFEEEKKRLDTERQLPVSLILGDVDGLKLFNDAFGHARGDRLLKDTAAILKRCCRSEDIVARVGGDEFCVLLPQTDEEQAQALCRRIREACSDPLAEVQSDCMAPSISLGHATRTSLHQSYDQLFAIAESMMYRRKLFSRKSMHSSILSSIKTTLQEKNHVTEDHAERLIVLAGTLGRRAGMLDTQLADLELLSSLHDIGKMSIEDEILDKRGSLTDREWLRMKQHPEVGYRIAMASPELSAIAENILSHHERWDGKGYPQGLSGTDIPLPSRIIAIADAYDAMTNDRPYRKALSHVAAMEEIARGSGTQFDPQLTRYFLEIQEEGRVMEPMQEVQLA